METKIAEGLIPESVPDHPHIREQKEIGPGESTIILDVIEGKEHVYKVPSSPTDYAYYIAVASGVNPYRKQLVDVLV